MAQLEGPDFFVEVATQITHCVFFMVVRRSSIATILPKLILYYLGHCFICGKFRN